MLQGDRFVALLKIRSLTYGAKYAFSVPCQNDACRARIEWELDLNELPCQASAKEALRRLADKAQSAPEQRSLKAKAEDAARNLERERRLTEEKLNRRATLSRYRACTAMNGPSISVHPYSFDKLCALIADFTPALGASLADRRTVVDQPGEG